jgi:hypothetical protein
MVTLVTNQGPWLHPTFNCLVINQDSHRHGYPGCKPGALVTLGSSTAWLQTKTPCPRHGYPGCKPGALVTNLGSSTAWSQTKTPCPRHGYPGYKPGALVTNLGSSTAWSQTKTPCPRHGYPGCKPGALGYKPRVFNCLVTNQDFHAPGMGTLVTNQGPWLLT